MPKSSEYHFRRVHWLGSYEPGGQLSHGDECTKAWAYINTNGTLEIHLDTFNRDGFIGHVRLKIQKARLQRILRFTLKP